MILIILKNKILNKIMKTILVVCSNFPCQLKSLVNGFSKTHRIIGVCQSSNVQEIKETKNIQLMQGIPLDPINYEKNAIEFTSGLILLKEKNIVPDIICCHVGFGIEMMIDKIFPNVPIIGYYEWLFPYDTISNTAYNISTMYKSTNIMNFTKICSLLITPTKFQKLQFPVDIQKRMMVLHEGVDIEYFKPDNRVKTNTNNGQKIITYVTRGLEPMRCFMQFINIIKLVLTEREDVIVKIVGDDVVVYDDNKDNISYLKEAKNLLGTELLKRVEFLGKVPKSEVLKIYQMSDLHFYFTKPYPISWSFLEAMSSGCVVVCSNNKILDEFIVDGENKNCFPTDHNDYQKSKELVLEILKTDQKQIRENARKYILDHYNQYRSESIWKNIVSTLIM